MSKNYLVKILFSILFLMSAITHAQTSHNRYFTHARQLLLVRTDGWDEVGGRLQRFERKRPGSPWQPVGKSVSVVVGKNGMGWGRGLLSISSPTGPRKKEGDGKAPAGVFRLSSAFGYAPENAASQIKMPYQHLTPTIECVDDAKSAYYNRILDKEPVAKIDWSSAEKMLRSDNQYQWGLFVDHNVGPSVPGSGSCIFMHIWQNAAHGTAGCTAMEQKDLEEILVWLNPIMKPVLVQLPHKEYLRLTPLLKLPRS